MKAQEKYNELMCKLIEGRAEGKFKDDSLEDPILDEMDICWEEMSDNDRKDASKIFSPSSHKAAKVEMTEIVMPSHTNHMGTCFGGTIMSWIDTAAAIAAQRVVGSVVTASVDSIEFKKPIKLGDIVTLKASVNRIWNSSMEVGVKITCQSPVQHLYGYNVLSPGKQVCKAYLTFVGVTAGGRKRRIIDNLGPRYTTSEELRRYVNAGHRRTTRLANKEKK